MVVEEKFPEEEAAPSNPALLFQNLQNFIDHMHDPASMGNNLQKLIQGLFPPGQENPLLEPFERTRHLIDDPKILQELFSLTQSNPETALELGFLVKVNTSFLRLNGRSHGPRFLEFPIMPSEENPEGGVAFAVFDASKQEEVNGILTPSKPQVISGLAQGLDGLLSSFNPLAQFEKLRGLEGVEFLSAEEGAARLEEASRLQLEETPIEDNVAILKQLEIDDDALARDPFLCEEIDLAWKRASLADGFALAPVLKAYAEIREKRATLEEMGTSKLAIFQESQATLRIHLGDTFDRMLPQVKETLTEQYQSRTL